MVLQSQNPFNTEQEVIYLLSFLLSYSSSGCKFNLFLPVKLIHLLRGIEWLRVAGSMPESACFHTSIAIESLTHD